MCINCLNSNVWRNDVEIPTSIKIGPEFQSSQWKDEIKIAMFIKIPQNPNVWKDKIELPMCKT